MSFYFSELDNDYENDNFFHRKDSDEDTEDASETEAEKKDDDFSDFKYQKYQDQLKLYRKQLIQLKEGTFPIYVKKMKRLESQLDDRLMKNQYLTNLKIKMIEENYVREKQLVCKEYEDKKSELKENLIKDFEHKKKTIEAERQAMELMGDSMSTKIVTTRKLRRRPNDPIPLPEKRSKPSPVQTSASLNEQEITEDINFLCNNKFIKMSGPPNDHMCSNLSPSNSFNPTYLSMNESVYHDVFVEENKLCFDKKWFHKDQSVVVEPRDQPKINGYLTSFNDDEICIKKVSDNTKLKIQLTQLQRGLYFIRKKL